MQMLRLLPLLLRLPQAVECIKIFVVLWRIASLRGGKILDHLRSVNSLGFSLRASLCIQTT